MTTRDHISKLANDHWHRDNFNNEFFDAFSFYHAVRNEALEDAAVKCDKKGKKNVSFTAYELADEIRSMKETK